MPPRVTLPLRARAGLAFGLTALLLSATLSVFAYALVRNRLLDEREETALRQAFTNARSVRENLDDETSRVPEILAGVQVGPSSVAVLRHEDQWFGTSVGAGPDLVPDALRQEVEAGHAGRQKHGREGEPWLTVGVPIAAFDAAYFELLPLTDVERTLDRLSSSLVAAGAVATLVGAVIGTVTSGAVLRPVRRMSEVAERIVDGALDSRLDAEGDPDLAPLVDSFNEMLDELRQRIELEQRFASDVAHEVREPLAALAAAVEVVKRRRAELPETVTIAVEALDTQVRSFSQLVLDLLEISRFDAGTARLDLEFVDLVAFVRALLDDRGLRSVRIHVSEGAPEHVACDVRRMQQVLANLVENAERYAGGVTAVKIAGDGQRVTIAVEDRGPGVAEEERSAIFGRFFRGSAADAPGAPRGTGLGLALVAQHVRLHGGEIRVENRTSGGARFVVEVPRSP